MNNDIKVTEKAYPCLYCTICKYYQLCKEKEHNRFCRLVECSGIICDMPKCFQWAAKL